MKNLNALALTTTVNDWLANSQQARILHVFDHACNLINERREVLSIVTPQIGNGPFNLVIQADFIFTKHLEAESSIFVRDEQLQLGDLAINSTAAALWLARPNWEALHAGREVVLNHVVNLPVTDHLLSNSLCLALATAHLSHSITAAQKLAGLGAGLTPAGDDFIMGALYAAWILHPFEVARGLAEEIANTAAPVTTSLSAAWLRSAGKGEAGILWHEFLDTLMEENTMQIQAAMDKILAVGETSGADALSGFIGTCVALHSSSFPNSPDKAIELIQR